MGIFTKKKTLINKMNFILLSIIIIISLLFQFSFEKRLFDKSNKLLKSIGLKSSKIIEDFQSIENTELTKDQKFYNKFNVPDLKDPRIIVDRKKVWKELYSHSILVKEPTYTELKLKQLKEQQEKEKLNKLPKAKNVIVKPRKIEKNDFECP